MGAVDVKATGDADACIRDRVFCECCVRVLASDFDCGWGGVDVDLTVGTDDTDEVNISVRRVRCSGVFLVIGVDIEVEAYNRRPNKVEFSDDDRDKHNDEHDDDHHDDKGNDDDNGKGDDNDIDNDDDNRLSNRNRKSDEYDSNKEDKKDIAFDDCDRGMDEIKRREGDGDGDGDRDR